MKISDIEVTPIHPERWGDDLDVVNAARVSFHKESDWEYDIVEGYADYEKPRLSSQDTKLINYLAKHKHFSPFNHSFCSFRVKAPIFVARQLVKHKFMPWNEVSRRYVDEEPEFYIPEMRIRAESVKQGSSEGTDNVQKNVVLANIEAACNQYQYLLQKNIAPEVARAVLPQNMMTEWVWSGTLGAFCDMLVLRLDPHTQYESRSVAQKIYDEMIKVFPVSVKARLGEV